MYTKKNTKWLTGGQEEMENKLEGENERKGERAVVSRGEKSEGGRKGGVTQTILEIIIKEPWGLSEPKENPKTLTHNKSPTSPAYCLLPCVCVCGCSNTQPV